VGGSSSTKRWVRPSQPPGKSHPGGDLEKYNKGFIISKLMEEKKEEKIEPAGYL